MRPSGRGTVPAPISMSTRRMCFHFSGVTESRQSGQVQEVSKTSTSYRFPHSEWTTYVPTPTNRASIFSSIARRVRGSGSVVRFSEMVLIERVSFLGIPELGRTTAVPSRSHPRSSGRDKIWRKRAS